MNSGNALNRNDNLGTRKFVARILIFTVSLVLVGCRPSESTVSNTPSEAVHATAKKYRVQADAVAVAGSSGKIELKASIPAQSVTLGTPLKVQVDVVIAPTFHIYQTVSADSAMRPLSIELELDEPALKVGEIEIETSAKELQGNKVYREKIAAIIPLSVVSEVTATALNIKIKMDYQACNDLICLPPGSISLNLPLEIVPE